MKRLLVIGHTYPEPATTAAGKRMMQLLSVFKDMKFEITFATTASRTTYSEDLTQHDITTQEIVLNDDSFDDFLDDVNPSAVLFDRFITEEQFSWRVKEKFPGCLRILDTEDLHFLRHSRELALKNDTNAHLESDIMQRELASILRSDISLIISRAEMNLLTSKIGIPEHILEYLPITFPEIPDVPSFDKRSGYMTIGNFQHAPNHDAVIHLVRDIWPGIRNAQPEATLHIYGAYATKEISDLDNPKNGIYFMGWAENLQHVVSKSRVLLAPLRFGAGLKGKILDAFYYGTPVVTTVIGAEGIAGDDEFGGVIAYYSAEFVPAAVKLHEKKEPWNRATEKCSKLINEHFSKDKFYPQFTSRITQLIRDLQNHREKNYLGEVIWHQNLKASYFMGKWITEKNQKKK